MTRGAENVMNTRLHGSQTRNVRLTEFGACALRSEENGKTPRERAERAHFNLSASFSSSSDFTTAFPPFFLPLAFSLLLPTPFGDFAPRFRL